MEPAHAPANASLAGDVLFLVSDDEDGKDGSEDDCSVSPSLAGTAGATPEHSAEASIMVLFCSVGVGGGRHRTRRPGLLLRIKGGD